MKTKRLKFIKGIKAIIKKYGSFGVGEVQADCSPCVQSRGGIVDLAEHFYSEKVTVNVYEESNSNGVEISSYDLPYGDLSVNTLEDILTLAKQYKENNY